MGKSFINEETRFEVVMGIYLNTVRSNEKDAQGKARYTEGDKDRAERQIMKLAKAVDGLKALEKNADTDDGKLKLCSAVWELQ